MEVAFEQLPPPPPQEREQVFPFRGETRPSKNDLRSKYRSTTCLTNKEDKELGLDRNYSGLSTHYLRIYVYDLFFWTKIGEGSRKERDIEIVV